MRLQQTRSLQSDGAEGREPAEPPSSFVAGRVIKERARGEGETGRKRERMKILAQLGVNLSGLPGRAPAPIYGGGITTVHLVRPLAQAVQFARPRARLCLPSLDTTGHSPTSRDSIVEHKWTFSDSVGCIPRYSFVSRHHPIRHCIVALPSTIGPAPVGSNFNDVVVL